MWQGIAQEARHNVQGHPKFSTKLNKEDMAKLIKVRTSKI